MTRGELSGVAIEEMLCALRELSNDAEGLGDRLRDDYPGHTPEDIEVLGRLIDEGREMLHEVWAMGS